MNISELYNLYKHSAGISTDSRKVEPGSIFFAIKGERFDGNQYAEKALSEGARYAVVDDPSLSDTDRMILVEDSLHTLQNLARYHRQQFGGKVIAITGSNGKTTSKELIYAALSQKFKCHATPGNWNNHLGVPLTLLQMPVNLDFAVVELGDNHPGEITELARIAMPDYGIVTNVGLDHLEGFGSPEEVMKARKELYDHLREHEGASFVHSDLDYLRTMTKDIKQKVHYGLDPQADYRYELISADPFVSFRSIKPESYEIQTRLIGRYNLPNLMLSATVASYFGVEKEQIVKALSEYTAANNRSQVIDFKENKILLDAYNANPSNVEAALENFSTLPATGKMVILGEMYELGQYSESEHQRIAKMASEMQFDQIITVGEGFKKSAKEYGFLHFKDADRLRVWFKENLPHNYWILIKGSRGVALEKILS